MWVTPFSGLPLRASTSTNACLTTAYMTDMDVVDHNDQATTENAPEDASDEDIPEENVELFADPVEPHEHVDTTNMQTTHQLIDPVQPVSFGG
ncbi:unnamed protein product [Sphagnum balticum]